MERYSKRCIKKYIETYNLILESIEKDDNYGLVGNLEISVKIDIEKKDNSRFDKSNTIKIGNLHYSISDDYDGKTVLHIDTIYIKSIYKPINITIKLTKVLLLYLLALHSTDIQSVTLVSTPNDSSKKGTEFCLACFYQELGFETVNFESKEMIKKCISYIGEKKKEKDMCILCRCQRYNKNILKENFPDVDMLQIDMKALLPRLEKLLKKANREINKKCL